MTSAEGTGRTVVEYVSRAFGRCLREPAGPLRHRFIEPGAGYHGLLWDWDAHFCAMGLRPWARQVGPYVQGCVMNFLDHMRGDGSIPYCLDARRAAGAQREPCRPADSPANTLKPLLAQMTQMACEYLGDGSWVPDAYPGLCRCLRHWEQTQLCGLGLFVFRSHRGSGADNNPAVYGRPLNSSADVFLNSLMTLEYGAMADLARKMGREADAADWRRKREALAAAIQRMWDPIDGMFYNLDALRHPIPGTNQPIDWAVPLKFRCWTSFAPMWAGVATPEQARRLLSEHLARPEEFWSDHGLRSMARCEPAYTHFAGSNPSNWQGPVWVVSTYIAFRGLLGYGYRAEAQGLAHNLLRTLARDIRENGCLHEYYHAETGEGLTHPGFLNWNTLAALLAEDVDGPRRCGPREESGA